MKIVLARAEFDAVVGKAIQEEYLNSYRDRVKDLQLVEVIVPDHYGDVTITYEPPPSVAALEPRKD